MNIKMLVAFVISQVLFYILASFVAWDFAWVKHLELLAHEERLMALIMWVASSVGLWIVSFGIIGGLKQ